MKSIHQLKAVAVIMWFPMQIQNLMTTLNNVDSKSDADYDKNVDSKSDADSDKNVDSESEVSDVYTGGSNRMRCMIFLD